jgi:copper chaperone CopZ
MGVVVLHVWTLTVTDVETGREARRLASAVERLPGVESASVNLDTKNVTVRGRNLTRESVRRTIADAGFHVA